MKAATMRRALRALLAVSISAVSVAGASAEILDTRIGNPELTHAFIDGYSTDATVAELFDEMDFQRAVQSCYRAMNGDGSVDIYMGPDRPGQSRAKNWILTEPGGAWSPWFRLFSPRRAFLDKTWVLPDMEIGN